MDSFIDEAGSFVIKGAKNGSWCVVSCYSSPEFEKKKYTRILNKLKIREGYTVGDEVKLYQVSEDGYIQFLNELSGLSGVLFSVATESALNSESLVQKHKDKHLDSIRRGRSEMKYEGGRLGMDILFEQVSSLPAQLYVQFHCQATLLLGFINRGIAYYVQRYPNSLKHFRWQYDRKEIAKITNFEDSFQKFVPTLLQAYSIDKPTPALKWCDYSPMEEYISEIPEYLVEKVPELNGEVGFDVQKIVRKDIKFVDSKQSAGVQIADLLASGLRKLLRLEFNDNERVATYFAKLMLQEEKNSPPISLVTFGSESAVENDLAKIIKLLVRGCRKLIK